LAKKVISTAGSNFFIDICEPFRLLYSLKSLAFSAGERVFLRNQPPGKIP
jgi:hypothetical protein